MLGISAGLGLQRAIVDDSAGGLPPYATFALLSLLTTMAVVAILGLTARPVRGPLSPVPTASGVPQPLRALRMRVARTSRYVGILWLGARYGLGPLTGLRRARDSRELAVTLRDALQEAGGIFVKFGQLLSARTDLVPAIALGAEAVVKAQRPEIERLVERDLDILRRLACAVEERAAWARQIGAVALANGFAANLNEEVDFRIEAQNRATIAAHDGTLRTPHVYRELSTRRLLVEEWIDARPLRQAQRDLAPHERKLLARSLLEGILGQIFEFGVFHADPHAGNVLVDGDGQVVLLDFGSVGRLDRLRQPAQALDAIARRRPTLLRDALVELSTSADVVDVDGLDFEVPVGSLAGNECRADRRVRPVARAAAGS